MNKYKARQKLKSLFARDGIIIHDDVYEEIIDLVYKAGLTKQFLKKYSDHIRKIKMLGKDVEHLETFEKLQAASGLYSMHFDFKDANLRMLYSYNHKANTIMLHLFYERDDTTRGRYDIHIPIALQRKKEMGEKDE